MDRTTYMFTYVDPQSKSPKLEELLEDYWNLIPDYQVFYTTHSEASASISSYVIWLAQILQVTFCSLVMLAAYSLQFPLGGFGSLTRHLGRLTNGKKKKKKKTRVPSEMQWRASKDFTVENYMMPMGPAYNPYWSGMQPGMEGFGGPFAGPMPYMGYGRGPVPVEFPYGGLFPQVPYGPPRNIMPSPPQRDLAGYGMGFNGGPPVMSREAFEAQKLDSMRKRELERHGDK